MEVNSETEILQMVKEPSIISNYVIGIDDNEHIMLLLKYFKKNGNIRPFNSESRFAVNPVNNDIVGSKKIFKTEILPSIGNFNVNLTFKELEVNFEISIIPDTNVHNSFESYGSSYASSNMMVSKKIFNIICKPEDVENISEAIEICINSSKDKTTRNLEIFYNKHGDHWAKLSESEYVQNLSQIFLPLTISNELITYIDEFIQLKDEYKRFGISHKFTILLEGKPGMGKTTISRAIAHHYNRRLYILNLANKNMSESDIIELFANIIPNSVLVMEDIDSFFVGRKSGECGSTISFSTIINLLDGSFSSKNGLITFITANNASHLDKALIRQGRIDKVIHFGDMTEDQFEAAWRELISKEEEPDKELFRICQRNKLSMSTLMHIFFFGKTTEKMRLMARQSVSERSFGDDGCSMYC